MSQDHHVIPQQRIKIARSAVAVKLKLHGLAALSDGEWRLYDTPLSVILNDRRNIVRLKNELHHRAHNGVTPYRLTRDQLPGEIDVFAAEYALEAALEHELRLIEGATSGVGWPE